MNPEQSIQNERRKIDALLRDIDFAQTNAAATEAAYYKGIGQPVPEFISSEMKDQVVEKPMSEEKVSINVAGFYALETCIGWFCKRDGKKPSEWLDIIVTQKYKARDVDLLNRFANATWKAGQPFRSLDRINRPVFRVFDYLSKEEVVKDQRQIIQSALKLRDSLKDDNFSSGEKQFEKIKSLLQDKSYAYEMAAYLEASYYTQQKKAVPPFLSPDEVKMILKKSAVEQKIATNLTGFYALECGLQYIVTTQKKLPSVVLESVINDQLATGDKELLMRFANATWKAGQPFRSMERITRDNFVPFNFLPASEIEKDWVQIKNAAQLVLNKLK